MSNQKQIIEQAKFTYSPLGKAFEKQLKTNEDQGEKQVKVIQNQGHLKTIGSNKDVDNESQKFFDGLYYERMSDIKDLSRHIDFNNLTYYFNSKSFKAPLHLHRDIFNGNIKNSKTRRRPKTI